MDFESIFTANVLLKFNFSFPPRRIIVASIAKVEWDEVTRSPTIVSSRIFAVIAAHSYLYLQCALCPSDTNLRPLALRFFFSSSLVYSFAAFSFPQPIFLLLFSLFLFFFFVYYSVMHNGARDFIRILLDCRDRFH